MNAPATQSSLPSIKRYLLVRILGIVVLSFAVFAVAAWLIVVRPAQDELARLEVTRAADEVEGDIRALTDQIERVLATARDWGRSGLVQIGRPHEIASLMIPVLASRPQISQVLVANSQGLSVQFGRGEPRGWLIREVDAEKLGGRQHWIHLNEDGGFVREEWVERERFDARTRPWYRGASGLAQPAAVHWTEPYLFFDRQEPGVTAAMQWTDRNSGRLHVIAVDVRLLDLSRFTSRVAVGEHGRTAVLTTGAKLLGVPRHPLIRTDDDIRQRVMKSPAEAGFMVHAAAWDRWIAEGRPAASTASFRAEGESWFGRFRPFRLGAQTLLIATVAPRGDFAFGSLWDAAAITGMMLLVVLLAYLFARGFSARFGGVMQALVAESERIGALQLDQPVQVQTGTSEVGDLVAAQERMRVMLLDATRGLEAKVDARTRELTALAAEQSAIFESATSGIALIQDRRIQRCNRKLEEIFGYAAGEFLGQPTRIWYPSDEAHALGGAGVYEQLARGETHRREQLLARKDGSGFWCRLTGRAVDAVDASRGSVWMFDDVTEEHAAAEALRTANERLDLAQEASHVGVFDVVVGGRSYWTPPLEQMFGLRPGTFAGTVEAWAKLVHPEDRERAQQAFDQALANPDCRSFTDEFRVVRPDGGVRWFQSICRIFRTPEGVATRAVGVNIDATELVSARRTAEEATRAKSMFLASMSHEIRTPMNGVLGLLQLLAFSKLDAEQKATLDGAHQSARSLLRIIDDLLDFSKIEAGKLEIRPEVTSVAAVIDSVRQVYSGVASAKDLSLRASLDPGISPALKVDPLRLRQILNNFVSNAVKFTAQGSVEITAKRLERANDREVVRFAVTDTGIGISKEGQARLFQPFIQATGDTAHQFGGTGLGLTICLRLAEMMGGRIDMQSEPGKGTTMALTMALPIADPRELPKAGTAADAAAATVASRRRAPAIEDARKEGTLVLVAEDHPTNRNIVVRLLNLLGYAAEVAEDGQTALEKWQAGRFGLLLTDCNMPVMDGYDLARAIRQREAGAKRRIPVVACTANALAGDVDRCLEAGMDDFVAKPIELEALARAMEKWLPLPGAGKPAAPRAAAAAPGPGAPLDRSSLAAISGGDAATEREILAEFRVANDADIAELRSALAARDIAKVTHASHRAKGACKMVGATALASVCERMENAGRQNRWDAVAAEEKALEKEFARLNRWLASN